MAKDTSINLLVEGEVLGNPTQFVLGMENNELVFGGYLELQNAYESDNGSSGNVSDSDVLKIVDYQMTEDVEAIVQALVPSDLSGKFRIICHKRVLLVSAQVEGVVFAVAKGDDSIAIFFGFQMGKIRTSSSAVIHMLSVMASFLGIEEFFFYLQQGERWLLPQMLCGNQQVNTKVLEDFRRYDVVCYTHLQFTDSNYIGRMVRALFQVSDVEIAVVAKLNRAAPEIRGILVLPIIKTGLIESNNLYIEVGMTGGTVSQLSFKLVGEFVIPLIKDVVFHVACGIESTAFELEAYAQTKSPIPLIGPFSIGDTCVQIKVSANITIGMYTTLYIRQIECAGAIMLFMNAGTVGVQLAAAALSDVSIPILITNLLGREVSGIHALDFLQIRGLPFADTIQYPSDVMERCDSSEMVEIFNRGVNNSAFYLEHTQVTFTRFGTGIDITDKKRMRHYFVQSSGRVQLTAQFYYAVIKTSLGEYSIEPGTFVCGVIEIFGKEFEVLFLSNQENGVVAYAKIPSMDLGFLKIESSSYKQDQQSCNALSNDSALTQFIDLRKEGIVFFLTATDNEVSFYLDGKVTLLGILAVDTRIIFCSGLISIDFQMEYYQLFHISVHIKVAYADFLKSNFEFTIALDTSGLAEKMNTVTKKIDAAISRLRNKIQAANREIEQAEKNVQKLYSDINNYRNKIKDCKNAIKKTSRWKRWAVAIVKGIEIGCYEVSIASIYVTIGLAQAALKVAQGVVTLSGIMSETVMKAVNGLIQGAMSLFYIQKIELSTSASMSQQTFLASMEFVALGKQYKVAKEVSRGTFQQAPMDVLSGSISNEMDYDLNHIEDGSYRSNWRKYTGKTYTIEENRRQLAESQAYLKGAVSLMEEMQNSYVEEFQMPIEESEELNLGILQALDGSRSILETGLRTGNVKEIASAMGGVKRSFKARKKKGAFRDGELSKMEDLIQSYDEARTLYNETESAIAKIRNYQEQIQSLGVKGQEARSKTANQSSLEQPVGDICKVVDKVEKQMFQEFPVDAAEGDYINLSKEPEILRLIEETDMELGRVPSKNLKNSRSRSKKGRYTSRL